MALSVRRDKCLESRSVRAFSRTVSTRTCRPNSSNDSAARATSLSRRSQSSKPCPSSLSLSLFDNVELFPNALSRSLSLTFFFFWTNPSLSLGTRHLQQARAAPVSSSRSVRRLDPDRVVRHARRRGNRVCRLAHAQEHPALEGTRREVGPRGPGAQGRERICLKLIKKIEKLGTSKNKQEGKKGSAKWTIP